ncbi:MAG: acryloyl-CoA reductase [Burkholderiales bacterium]|nr:acryloyl-CoA reductase [Burkholderiales bacterium]
MTQTFKAIRGIDDGGVRGRCVDMAVDALDAGEVLIRVDYSGINYKDALAVTGRARIVTRAPCNIGIEAAGIVASSSADDFRPGDAVIVHGFGLGMRHDGGFAQYVRVPAAWVVKLPAGLTTRAAATLGVAGVTAATAVAALEEAGVRPADGEVLVTGASGGCGGLAVEILARKGYRVVAQTRSPAKRAWLTTLGAAETQLASEVADSGRPLETARFAGVVDSIGGQGLSWALRSTRENGAVATYGNAAGNDFATSVLPFILRGIRLIGINGNLPMPRRLATWARLGSDLAAPVFSAAAREIRLDDAIAFCNDMIEGRTSGRTLIAMQA